MNIHSRPRRPEPLFAPSAFTENVRALAGALEAAGWTKTKLKNLSVEARAELIERFLSEMPGTAEILRGEAP